MWIKRLFGWLFIPEHIYKIMHMKNRMIMRPDYSSPVLEFEDGSIYVIKKGQGEQG